MKLLHIYILILLVTVLAAGFSVSAQSSDPVTTTTTTTTTSADNGYTSERSVSDKPADTTMTAMGTAIVSIGVLIIALTIFYMVKNRRRNIGGIQSQDKGEPTPRTTQSIDNPGAGV